VIELNLTRPAEPGVVSVLLPTRYRSAMLRTSLTSLVDTCARPDLLEILVARDPDDEQTVRTTAQLAADLGSIVHLWTAPERYGYRHSSHYYAALIERARGEWMLPTWGDDGIMTTSGWDDQLRALPADTVAWLDGNISGMTCFPAVHRGVLDVVGRICELPAQDTHWEYVAHDAGVLVKPDPGIYVLQDRFDITGRNNDALYRESRFGYAPTEFHDEEHQRLRAEDARKLIDAKEKATT